MSDTPNLDEVITFAQKEAYGDWPEVVDDARAELIALRSSLAASERALAEAKGLLSDVEWNANADGDSLGHCPFCGESEWNVGKRTASHERGCKLGALLSESQ